MGALSSNSMKTLLALLLTASAALAADPTYSRVIFADDFATDGFKKDWGHFKSNSVVKDGMLIGITGESSDHSAVDNIRFPEEKDLEVSVKFRFVSEQAKSFGLWFDDKDYKGSHAGHITQVSIAPGAVNLSDAKTGSFMNEIYERSKAPGSLTAEDKKLVATKRKTFPVKLALQEWHTMVARTHGDTLSVTVDGQPVGSFQSEGIAHETKSLVSLTTNRVDVQYDDFSVKAPAKP